MRIMDNSRSGGGGGSSSLHHHHQSALNAALASAAAANRLAALSEAANGGIRPGGVAHASIVQSLTNAAADSHVVPFVGSSASSATAGAATGAGIDGEAKKSKSNNVNSGSGSKGKKLCSLPNSSKAPVHGNDDRPFNTGRWSDEEHQRFLDGLNQYGTFVPFLFGFDLRQYHGSN